MPFGIIYKATSPSNKIYYGKTTKTLEERKKEHNIRSRKQNYHFSNAIKKYGINSFSWDILESYEIENIKELEKILNEREIFWIKKDQTNIPRFGYNMTLGGEGSKGLKRIFSPEHIRNLQESHRNKKLTQEHKDNIGKSKKGIIFSEEHREELRKSKMGENNPMYGKKISKETKEKLEKASREIEKIKCPHCNKEFTPWGIVHHFKKLNKNAAAR